MKYEEGDIVILKKKAGLFNEYDELHKFDRFRIIEVDKEDDDLPYLIEFYIAGIHFDYWISQKDIKKIAGATYVGGE